MVSHCDSGCCATWFAGWEKALESAETIPTAQEMPISHRASFISAPTWRVSYRATDSWLIVTQGNRGRGGYSIFDLGALQGGSARVDSCTTKRGAQSSPVRKSFATRRNISPKRRSSALPRGRARKH